MSEALRIAIIDDNENDRALEKRELRRAFEDVEFVEVIDRAGFDQLLERERFDALITDFAFGWSNGLEVLKLAKDRYPDLPVIMFAATANEEIVAEAMKSGLDDYILKSPKRFARLPAAVRLAMNHAAVHAAQTIAEERLHATLIELREQREWLATTMRSIASGVIATDAEGRILIINPAAHKLTGWTSAQATGKDIAEVFHLLAETGDPVAEIPARLALRGDPTAADEHDYILVGRSGRRLFITDSAAAIRDESGKIQGSVTVFSDISDRKLMLRELARSNQELQQFTYAAAHDLREPVRTVRAFTELLERRHGDDLKEDGKKILSYIVSGARRMEEMVDGLFRYGQASHEDPEVRDISADEVLRLVTTSMKQRLDENHATVEWNGLPRVRADRNQLALVFQNLISNAVKYRRAEPPQIEVTADASSDEEWLFCVADNGIGIAPRHRHRVFDIFERIHPNDYPGAGIGLSICRRLIERNGGRIWVESEEGRGSRFCFTLPKPQPAADFAVKGNGNA